MPATNKAKPAAPGKRAASGKRAAPTEATSTAGRSYAREIAAAIMFVFSIFLILSVFGVKAMLLDMLAAFVGGLVGVGFFVAPLALGSAAFFMIFRAFSRHLKARITCILCIPVVLGCWGHLFAGSCGKYGFDLFRMAADGASYASGGLVAGGLAELFSTLLSPWGAAILFLFAALICGIYVANGSVREFAALCLAKLREIKEHRAALRAEREEAEAYDRAAAPITAPRTPARRQEPAPRRNADSPAPIDIPLSNATDPPKGVFRPTSAFSRPMPMTNDEPTIVKPLPKPAQPQPQPSAPIKRDTTIDFQLTPPDDDDPLIGDDNDASDLNDPLAVWNSVAKKQPEPPEPPVRISTAGAVISPPSAVISPPAVVSPPAPDIIVHSGENAEPDIVSNIDKEDTRKDAPAPPQTEYLRPPVTLLTEDNSPITIDTDDEIKSNAQRLLDTLTSFNIDARIANITHGPSITRYEIQLNKGIRLSKLTNLSDDIALALGAQAVRIAPIPDRVSIVGIEVPNRNVSTVHIRDCIASKEFADSASKVTFALGKDITGRSVVWDIAKLPHMLVAGTTGSGKSVCVNSLLISILYKATPDEVKLIMIDPKIIELGVYNGIPHLLIPVVTDPKKAAGALQWAVVEMMKRYKLFAELSVRSIFDYNAEVARRAALPEQDEDAPHYERMPQIVIVIDELADLMLVAAGEVEEAICRIAQMARAAGMHLVIATQRPSADVITGLMKANIPSRIAFAVASQLESRIILDTMGAEKLVGRGDMLFNPIGANKPTRIQGCFISSSEVEAVVAHVKKSGNASYSQDIMDEIERAAEDAGTKGGKRGSSSGGASADDSEGSDDQLIYDAIDVVMENHQASASLLQRRLKLGYARAARIIDQMEDRGIIGSYEGSKPRQILISKQEWAEIKARR